jgi:hypothetical protein
MYRKIRVYEYGGFKGGERPLRLLFDDETVEVEVVDRWIEEDLHTRKRRRYFRLKDSLRREYLVYYDEKTHEWYIKL